jgi:hypothetical protein
MKCSLEIYVTGDRTAVMLIHLNSNLKFEILSEDYKGEAIHFPNKITITGLKPDGISCNMVRFSRTAGNDLYVETGMDYFNDVHVARLSSDLPSTSSIQFRCVEPKWELKPATSIFDEFTEKQEVTVTVDRTGETTWSSNYGSTTGENYKIEDLGLFVFEEVKDLNFSTYFDRLDLSLAEDFRSNASGQFSLYVNVTVYEEVVMTKLISASSVDGNVLTFKFKIYENLSGYDTDTEPSDVDEERIRLPPKRGRRRITQEEFTAALEAASDNESLDGEQRILCVNIPRDDTQPDDALYDSDTQCVSFENLPQGVSVVPAHVIMTVTVTSSSESEDEDN